MTRDIIVRRHSTGESINGAYFEDMGHIGTEPHCGHLSRVVIDGKNYDSWNPCGITLEECYKMDMKFFHENDISFDCL